MDDENELSPSLKRTSKDRKPAMGLEESEEPIGALLFNTIHI
jgi:hypothetical protein